MIVEMAGSRADEAGSPPAMDNGVVTDRNRHRMFDGCRGTDCGFLCTRVFPGDMVLFFMKEILFWG